MSSTEGSLTETVTLRQAKELIRCLAHEQSLLLLSPPGVGKSDVVRQAAAESGLPCKSLLGTQISPEDVSGVPRIIGERSVFCPPRVLLPENSEPFCLFLDELPACAPDVQKAFYSLLLERRLGEYPLPPGTWVVAAGNRAEDRALVRTISSALVNRVLILHIRIDVIEWLNWAKGKNIRPDICKFITEWPDALLRPVPKEAVPFSTPRAWASLARALDLAEKAMLIDMSVLRALARGRVTPSDADEFALGYYASRGSARAPVHPTTMTTEALAEFRKKPLADLGLAVRTANCLEREGWLTIGQLLDTPEEHLLEIWNFGEPGVKEVRDALARHGLSMRRGT